MSKATREVCSFPECGRPVRSLGLCQTHYKQKLHGEELKPIAKKRSRRTGTKRYAGFSLTEQCVSVIEERAAREKRTPNAVITDVLEAWARKVLGKE